MNISNTSYMSMKEFDCIGLDLDHTICKYKLDKLFTLLYELSSRALVEDRGYDESLLSPLEMNKDFCIKGLLIDIPRGDFLKLSESGFILRASNGTRVLSVAEIEDKYGAARQWEHLGQLEENLEQNEIFRYIENYYDFPLVVLLSRVIDLENEKPGGWESGRERVLKDIIYAYRGCFIQSDPDKGPGVLDIMAKNPAEYVEVCTPQVKSWLRGLREHCKIVFLLSSAYPQFCVPTMNYMLGEDWNTYFHICLLNARKPGFFSEVNPRERPFFTNVNGKAGEEVMELQHGGCYLEGNITTFNQYLRKVTGQEQPKVLYFGDSMRSDIFPSKRHCDWQNVLILEEMEVEELVPNGTLVAMETDETDDTQRSKIEPSQLEREYLLSNQWGSFFGDHLPTVASDDTDTGTPLSLVTNTLWTRFVKTYATIAIPKIDYMADFPTDFKFETFSSSDWRKGYHPGMPRYVTS